MSESETRFSKTRVEMLCDGIFCVAMTLLVLELKVPNLPKRAESAEIWHALREHALRFLGFALTFVLASTFWLLHHQMFQRLRHVNKALVMLTIPFLMFVSLLPFSTSMLTAFSLRQPVALAFYLGNQFALAALLSAQWLVANRSGLVTSAADDTRQREFGRMIVLQPISYFVSLVFVYISPRNAMLSVFLTQMLLLIIVRRGRKARPAAAAAPGPA